MKAHDPIKELAAKQLGIPVDQVTAEQAQIAAKCINHADKLADALEACMNIIGNAAWRDDCYKQYYEQAVKALEYYRSANDRITMTHSQT